MKKITRLILPLLTVAFLCTSAMAAEGKKKVYFLVGGPSHGFGAHDHLSGCSLLAARVSQIDGFEGIVVKEGWPQDPSILDDAAAIVMYSDGGGGHFGLRHIRELDKLFDKGVGIGAIHYAVEVPADEGGEFWLKWMGGYFETEWSVNPHWKAVFTKFPDHPISNGIKAFATQDEWYYNMRFREGMKGVTAVLTAIPPDQTRQGADSSHGGNPEVRKYIGQNRPEHVLWASEHENGSRGFGTTGGHFHWNWAHDDFRNVVLNAIIWIAKGEVPEGGVQSTRPTVEEMLSNHDEEVPAEYKTDEKKAELQRQFEEMNKPLEETAAK